MTIPDPTPRPLDELRERCVEAAEEAVTSRHRNSVSGSCNPGCCFNYAYGARAADAVIPLVEQDTAERIAAWIEWSAPQGVGHNEVVTAIRGALLRCARGVRSGTWKEQP